MFCHSTDVWQQWQCDMTTDERVSSLRLLLADAFRNCDKKLTSKSHQIRILADWTGWQERTVNSNNLLSLLVADTQIFHRSNDVIIVITIVIIIIIIDIFIFIIINNCYHHVVTLTLSVRSACYVRAYWCSYVWLLTVCCHNDANKRAFITPHCDDLSVSLASYNIMICYCVKQFS